MGCSKPIRTTRTLLPPIPEQHSAAAAAAAAAARSIGGRGKDIPRVAALGGGDGRHFPSPSPTCSKFALRKEEEEEELGSDLLLIYPPPPSKVVVTAGRSFAPFFPPFLRKRRRHLADKKIDRKG